MENNTDEFSFFAPEAYLIKSGDAKSYKFGGCFTTEDRDVDGEILLSDGMDLNSYFMNGWGKIKYEHPDYLETFIGAPTKVWKKGNKSFFEAEFYPFHDIPEDKLNTQQKAAKGAYDLLKNTREWNRLNPTAPQQKVGFSVEGEWRKSDKDPKTGIIKKSRVVNVVLTTKPRNRGTHAELMKSLEVGYAHGITDQTGFGATRLQSIAKDSKKIKKSAEFEEEPQELIESITNTFNNIYQEHKPMKKFGDKKECHEHYKSLGLDDDEAGALADKWEKRDSPEDKAKEEAEAREKEKLEKTEKSLGITDFRNSIAGINEVLKLQPKTPLNEIEEKLSKSIKINENGDIEDLSGYFKAKQEFDLSTSENISAINEKIDLLAKSIGVANAGFIQLGKSIGTNNELNEVNARALAKSLKARSASGGLSTDNLNEIEYAENNNLEKSIGADLKRGEVVTILDKLADEGKISRLEVSKAEFGTIDKSIMQLAKSHRDLLHK